MQDAAEAARPAAVDPTPAAAHRRISGAAPILFILFVVNLLNFFDRTVLGGLVEPIRREFGLDDTALGLLATVFTVVYAVLGLPVGRLADRRSRPILMSIGLALWSLFTLASGLARSYGFLFIARIGVGIGETSCAPAAQSLIGDLYPRARRARAMALFMLGLPIGVLAAFLVAAELAPRFGWRTTLVLAAAPGLLVAAVLLRVQEPERGSADTQLGAGARRATRAAVVLRTPTLWWIIASGALQNFSLYALNTFQTAFLQRYHGLGLRAANHASALVLGAVGVLGMLLGGWLGDWLAVRSARARLLLAAGAMLLAAPCLYLALGMPRGQIAGLMTLMGIGMTLVFTYYSTVYATIQDVIEPRNRGMAVSIYFFAMYMLGASAGPVATGWLSDHFARAEMRAAGGAQMLESFRALGLHDAMYVIPVLVSACALVLYAGSRTVSADVERLRLRATQA